MELTIISPTDSYTYQTAWFEVTTGHGSFVVQKGHVPMIVTVAPNSTFYMGLHDSTTKNLQIKNGILRIDRTHATLLVTQE